MTMQDVSLNDRFDLEKSPVLLNGTQALVRLMLMQRARDAAAGLDTAGYVTGYRGSPLGAVDVQMGRASKLLEANQITFQPGLNEDLAATAIWGSQQAELRGEGRHDGVFGLWYGKGPGVDRSGDVMRHANMAGTSPHGGVIMAMGDDHTGESSTTLHQSDWAMVDTYMPVLSPAGVQEILDFGLFGYALSRYSGLWVGLKTMKDTVEATSVVHGDPHRLSFRTPELALPPGGLNIRLGDTPVAQEARIIDWKRVAAEAFGRANRMDRRVWGKPGARIGFVAAGKNWLDLSHALDLLGIDEAEAERLGITTYKVGMTWPLDMASFHDWAEGLDLIVVVEEKRKLIEVQVKEAIFDDRRGRRVYGWRKGASGEELFPTRHALDPVTIALKLGGILVEEGRRTDRIEAAVGPAPGRHARRQRDRPGGAQALLLLGLPTQHVDQGARGLAGLRGGRLPLHGHLDGPGQHVLRADGGRGRELDRGGAVLQAPARVPEPRRRDLQPLGRAGDPRGAGGGHQHHLQDPLQRRRGHDRRADQRGRADGLPHRGRAARHGRAGDPRRLRPEGGGGPRSFPQGRAHGDARPDGRGAARAARGAGRLSHRLRADLRRGETTAAQEGPVPRPRPPDPHQHRRVRGLRRLRRAVQLRLAGARRDGARPQAGRGPVLVQQGLLVPRGVLPLLRHGRGREDPQGGHGRRGDRGPARARAARDRRHAQRRHHGRRRHGRRDRGRDPVDGGAPGGPRRRHDRDGGPGAEGRGGPHPLPPGRAPRGHQRDPRRHGRGACGDRRRSRDHRGRQDAGADADGSDGRGGKRTRDHHGRLHAEHGIPIAD